MTKSRTLCGWLLLVSGVCFGQSTVATSASLQAQDVKVTRFEDLSYPATALSMDSEGLVVIRAKLNKSGDVQDASAISGKEELVSETLSNIKRWRFQPNAAQSAVIVYNFSISKGECKTPSSVFVLNPFNLATITACRPATVTNGAPASSAQKSAGVSRSDKDVEVVDFQDLRCPLMAASAGVGGIVVVEAKLDETGKVLDASTIVGHPMLTADSLANIKKWQFRPNLKRRAVVVYYFTFPPDGYRYVSDLQHQFVLEQPNFAIVTGMRRLAQP